MIRRLCVAAAGLVLALPGSGMAADHPGKAVYEGTCVACHGADGRGTIPGVPDFTKPGSALSKPEDHLVANVINGFQTPGSPLAMPPKGGNPGLTEDDVRNVVRYMKEVFKR